MKLSETLHRLELGSGRLMNFYFGVYALLFMAVAAVLLSYPKAELHLMLNSWHSPFWDMFFRFFSTLAEWPLYVAAALLCLMYKRKRWFYGYLACELTNTVICFVIKLFDQTPRPLNYFKELYPDVQLPVVEGVHLHHICSFPSGHSCTFFIFFTFWGILLAHHSYQQGMQKNDGGRNLVPSLSLLLMLGIACIGGFSRIYLSQHFLLDVWAGSLLGICIVSTAFVFFAPKIENKL